MMSLDLSRWDVGQGSQRTFGGDSRSKRHLSCAIRRDMMDALAVCDCMPWRRLDLRFLLTLLSRPDGGVKPALVEGIAEDKMLPTSCSHCSPTGKGAWLRGAIEDRREDRVW